MSIECDNCLGEGVLYGDMHQGYGMSVAGHGACPQCRGTGERLCSLCAEHKAVVAREDEQVFLCHSCLVDERAPSDTMPCPAPEFGAAS